VSFVSRAVLCSIAIDRQHGSVDSRPDQFNRECVSPPS
jgi:hypothetical protein